MISSGLAEYKSGADTHYLAVFERADQQMYIRKRALKKKKKKKNPTRQTSSRSRR